MGKLDGKIALITGGNKGIGKGIARGLAAEGATLVLAARGVEELNQTAEELREGGTTVLAVPTDVTDEAQIEALFERTMETFNRLDILVNNSGAFDGGPLDELSTEALDNVLSVNLRAPFSVYACSDADYEAAGQRAHYQHREYLCAACSTGNGPLLRL